jgi:hypothetical protein
MTKLPGTRVKLIKQNGSVWRVAIRGGKIISATPLKGGSVMRRKPDQSFDESKLDI